MERIYYKLIKDNTNKTLKEFMESFYVSKSSIYKMFFNKQVYINDVIVNEKYIIKEGDILGIDTDERVDVEPWESDLDIVFEDENVLIVNKPVGIIIHSDGSNINHTLVNMVASYYNKKGLSRNVRYIHRIDKETSGIVVFAKDYLTYCRLNHQIETHEIKREYLALVQGDFKEYNGSIDAPIGRDRHVSNKFRVGKSSSSKEAKTNYWIIKNFGKFSYLRLLLETGRTHQIRVHMSSINHPLLGDTLYGGKKDLIDRVALHSFRVSYVHPYSFERMIIEIDPPKDINDLILW